MGVASVLYVPILTLKVTIPTSNIYKYNFPSSRFPRTTTHLNCLHVIVVIPYANGAKYQYPARRKTFC